MNSAGNGIPPPLPAPLQIQLLLVLLSISEPIPQHHQHHHHRPDATPPTRSNPTTPPTPQYHEIENAVDLVGRMGIDDRDDNAEGTEQDGGSRIPLPWEILQPVLRIMGHCLLAPVNSQEVKDAAAAAVRRLYARASHDLVPQAILATRSLIQIDNRAHAAARAAVIAAASSKASTPTKAKKPEVLLASK